MREMPVIGKGTYTLTEAARYAGVPAATARAWFDGRANGQRGGRGPVFESDLIAVSGDRAVSFLNLVEVYVARFFRREGVSPARLRKSHELLKAELGVSHPFAHADLRTDGRRVILATTDGDLREVISRQQFFTQMRLGRFQYDPGSRLANRWRIADGVVIDPALGFGKPTVLGSGVTTFVLANQYRANGENAAIVAELYEVSEADVRRAVRFEEAYSPARLRSVTASAA